MSDPWLLGVLLAGVIALTPLADLVRVPQPVLLAVFGLIAGLMPFAGPLDLEPDLVLPVVLPPLLFAATQRTTSTEFRAEAERVLALAVGLTICTAVAVALVAHAVGLEWGPAWILGAIVSPPDPVAATAVARKLRLPDRLVTILEGEGMFNDATALVMYSAALAAVATGEFSYGSAGLELVLTLVVGVAVGFAVGLATKWLIRLIRDAYTETTITVVVPFVAYLGAEHLHGSGVLAVLVLGLYLRNVAHEETTSRGWLLGRSVWAYADFLITSLAFAVLGFELSTLLADVPVTREVVTVSVSVVLTVVLLRIAWVFPVGGLFRLLARKQNSVLPNDWREITVVSWSGMRGVVTVATAVAIPMTTDDGASFPDRHLLVVAALVCVLVTLVVQGLTLGPLTSWLGVGGDADDGVEVAELRGRAAGAALDYVRALTGPASTDEVKNAAILQYEGYLEAQRAMHEARLLEVEGADPAEELDQLLRKASDVERQLVLDERRQGKVSAAAADEVLRDIESRALRDLD
ncbi:Na+/H+ antiporter [Nocardioides sp. CN2-186]|uniref:Na+/H+ antiporter n=1 Tax=Nocardioides tweenelious TaxID=3156607 RepID=UPI0032B3E46C